MTDPGEGGGRYVLSVVGTVESAVIDSKLERTVASLESPASVIRRARALPDPEFYLKEVRDNEAAWRPHSPDHFKKYARYQEKAGRFRLPAISEKPSPSVTGVSPPVGSPGSTLSVSPDGKLLQTDGGDGSPAGPAAGPDDDGRKGKQREESPNKILKGDFVFTDRGVDVPLVYRVFEPNPDQLEALNQKVNYLKILEKEAIELEMQKEKSRKDERRRKEKEARELERRIELGRDLTPAEQEKEDRIIEKEYYGRPKVTQRYQLALDADSGMQLMPRIGQQVKDIAWEGPFQLDVEIICKEKDAVIETESEEEDSTQAETELSELTASDLDENGQKKPAWMDEAVELTRIAVQFDIAPQFGPILMQYITELQSYFIQKLRETYDILGDEIAMRPETELQQGEEVHCLGFRLNVPKGHPDCPDEEEIQDLLEVALMEILMKITGKSEGVMLGRRGKRGSKKKKGGADLLAKGRAERKKYKAEKKLRKAMDEVRGLSEEEMRDFVKKLLEEMEYRIKVLEEVRKRHAFAQGYKSDPKFYDEHSIATMPDREGHGFYGFNGPDGRVKPTLKPVIFIPGITKKRPDITGNTQATKKVYTKEDVGAADTDDSSTGTSLSSKGNSFSKAQLNKKKKKGDKDAEYDDDEDDRHPLDPANCFASPDDLTPRTKQRTDTSNPDSYANYCKRVRFLNSLVWLTAARDHGREKHDLTWFTREWQTMYLRFLKQQNAIDLRKLQAGTLGADLSNTKKKKKPKKEEAGEGEEEGKDPELDEMMALVNESKNSELPGFDASGSMNAAGGSMSKPGEENADGEKIEVEIDDEKWEETQATPEQLLEWKIFDEKTIDKISLKVVTKPPHLDEDVVKARKAAERMRHREEKEEARIKAEMDIDAVLENSKEFGSKFKEKKAGKKGANSPKRGHGNKAGSNSPKKANIDPRATKNLDPGMPMMEPESYNSYGSPGGSMSQSSPSGANGKRGRGLSPAERRAERQAMKESAKLGPGGEGKEGGDHSNSPSKSRLNRSPSFARSPQASTAASQHSSRNASPVGSKSRHGSPQRLPKHMEDDEARLQADENRRGSSLSPPPNPMQSNNARSFSPSKSKDAKDSKNKAKRDKEEQKEFYKNGKLVTDPKIIKMMRDAEKRKAERKSKIAAIDKTGLFDYDKAADKDGKEKKKRSAKRTRKPNFNSTNHSFGSMSLQTDLRTTGMSGGKTVITIPPRKKKKDRVPAIPPIDWSVPDRKYPESNMWSEYSIFRDAIKEKFKHWAEDSAGQPNDLFDDGLETWDRLMNQQLSYKWEDKPNVPPVFPAGTG